MKKEHPPPPPPGKCNFFVKRKFRYCKLESQTPESQFCGEHSPNRVVCPIDGSHTVAKSKLKLHLKRCPSLKSSPKEEDGFEKDVNIVLPSPTHTVLINTKPLDYLKSLSEADLKDFISRIETLFSKFKDQSFLQSSKGGSFRTKVLQHASIPYDDSDPSKGSRKHIKQVSSLVENMNEKGLLNQQNVCFLELGSGRGLFSHALQGISTNSKFLLVDRENFRLKFDRLFVYNNDVLHNASHRIKMDIKDLDLNKVKFLEQDRKIICVSKHLCGAAMDLSLKCLTQVRSRLAGIVIAICCHQKCISNNYINQKFLNENGITHDDFSLLSCISTWATNGRKAGLENDNHWSGLAYEKRCEIGLMSKRIIDMGRVDYIRKVLQMDVELIYYVEKETSPENLMMIAINPAKEE